MNDQEKESNGGYSIARPGKYDKKKPKFKINVQKLFVLINI